MKPKLSMVFGTRPEIIKLAPIIKEFKKCSKIEFQTVFTNQHKDIGISALNEFGIKPDVKLSVNRNFGDLNELLVAIQNQLHELSRKDRRPDLVMIHGDTATSYATAMFCYHFNIPIAHVEAGLRSHDLSSPFPEEFYRQSIAKIAKLHFAPTEKEKSHLIKEAINPSNIFVVGNSVHDAIRMQCPDDQQTEKNNVLITIHRRVSAHLHDKIHTLILSAAQKYPELSFEFLKHPSVKFNIENVPQNVKFIEPLSHKEFILQLKSLRLLITDSGGAQEEAAFLNVPTLLMRSKTERSDGIESGLIELIGLDEKLFEDRLEKKLSTPASAELTDINKTSGKSSSEKIVEIAENFLLGLK